MLLKQEEMNTKASDKKRLNEVRVLTVLRERKGWSRLELARRSRNAPSAISCFESGRVIPYEVQLRRIARALGWPVADAHRLLEPIADDDDRRSHSETEPAPLERTGVQ
jgi:transcriptional regulator with XRE-family HTH domain